MEFADDAHADTIAKLGPLNPYFIEICPAVMSGSNLGIIKGLNRGTPSPSQ